MLQPSKVEPEVSTPPSFLDLIQPEQLPVFKTLVLGVKTDALVKHLAKGHALH